jgi:lipoate-protein ligase A
MVRLIRGPSADGAQQMALDVAMARRAERTGEALVRVYRFDPPTVSLGRFQSVDELYLPGVQALGAGLCRRPTGGQAVFHDDEVTYALAVPRRALPEHVLESYRRIAEGLLRALAALGVQATIKVEEEGGRERESNCFLWPAPAEVTVAGRKLLGSAQCRMGGSFLQHGALPLRLDAARWAKVFAPPERQEEMAARLHARAVGLDALVSVPREAVETALLAGLAGVFPGGAAPLDWQELLAEGVAPTDFRAGGGGEAGVGRSEAKEGAGHEPG